MKKKLLLSTFVATSLFASDASEIETLKKEVAELKKVTQALIDETSDLKTGFNYTVVDTTKSYSGLSSAASKIYYSKSPLSIGGYGEMYLANQQGDSTDKRTLDVYRFVPYIGYKFSDNIILNTELEFEHGGAQDGEDGYVIIEFMYLDFLINSAINVRLGHFLTPLGLINEKHEPTLFTTVQRPNTEKNIIPSTWHDSGVMLYGNLTDTLEYKLGAISSLQTGVNGSKWIRDGRGGSFKQTDPNLGFVARVDYTGIDGLLIGASAYTAPALNGYESQMSIVDAHMDYKLDAFRAYGVYSEAYRSNADAIAGDAVEKATGGYLNVSYDLLSLFKAQTRLPFFVQYESLQEEAKRVDNTEGDTTKTLTIGLNYFAHEQVVLKCDHALQSKGSLDDSITSLSLGFIF